MSVAPEDLKNILGPNEQVQIYIKQKFYHPKINIDSVIITNERIILRHPHALGLKKDYTDFNYQDIANVVLKKGIIRSTVNCTLRLGGDPLLLASLRNSEAERAYGLIREPSKVPDSVHGAIRRSSLSTVCSWKQSSGREKTIDFEISFQCRFVSLVDT